MTSPKDFHRLEKKIDLIMMKLRLPIGEPARDPRQTHYSDREIPLGYKDFSDITEVEKEQIFQKVTENIGFNPNNSGHKISAIKEVRYLTGLGLKVSKALVDEYILNNSNF